MMTRHLFLLVILLMSSAPIASAGQTTGNPCTVPINGPVAVNPTKVFFESTAHDSPTLDSYRFIIRESSNGEGPIVHGWSIPKGLATPVAGFPSCYAADFVNANVLVKDGIKQYFSYYQLISSDPALTGPESGASNPFVLTPMRLPVGAIRLGR